MEIKNIHMHLQNKPHKSHNDKIIKSKLEDNLKSFLNALKVNQFHNLLHF